MSLIADGLLISAAAAACFYCWSLSRRLGALKRTDEGLGASIKALAGTVEQTRETLKSARAEADAEQERLRRLIEEARAASDMIAEVSGARGALEEATRASSLRQEAFAAALGEAAEVEERMSSALRALESIDAANVSARDAQIGCATP